MIILRNREFSRFTSGLKQAGKSAWTGAKIGAVLAPGNLIALGFGKKKLALGLTAGGALVGAGIGASIGYKDGAREYEFKEKMKTPEGRLEVLNGQIDLLKGDADECRKKALEYIKKRNFRSFKPKYVQYYKKLGFEVPKEVLDYVDFYSRFATPSNINLFYKDLIDNPSKYVEDDGGDSIQSPNVPDFLDLFPAPVDPEDIDSLSDFVSDYEICITVSEAADSYIYWDPKGNYYFPAGRQPSSDSLGDIVKLHTNFYLKYSDEYLNKDQKSLVMKFRNGLK